ncbi:VOC family protein [Terrabacter ginsenosidimutans]|uniref:Putative pterin-4-alpha-carbinolamine dehydratase n=1 Tax=Terrabacter ginsenosidimutans TaxID=490575 RepID=A0ABP7DJG8_9MICO
MPEKLTRRAASDALPTWRFLLQRMHLTVRASDAATAYAFVARVGEVTAALGRGPDLDVRGDVIHLAVSTGPADGVTADDIAVGRAVDTLVAEMGLRSEPGTLTVVEIAIDAMDIDAVRPFWDAVLGWDVIARNDVQDPLRLGPAVWFQQMDEPRLQRNRIHLDVTVAHDEAAGRIERALAAGGHLVSDAEAPAFWILADPEGNEACVCTWQGRDPQPDDGSA